MSTTVAGPGGIEVTSNYESAESMVAALSPEKAESGTPRVIVDKGVPVPEKDATSEAASVLGKKGGHAAAKARAAEAKGKGPTKDAKPAETDPDAHEAVEAEAAGEEEQPEKPLGKPRDDPKARIAVLARERREAEERADRAERRAADLERQRAQPAERDARDPRPEPPPKPKVDDFETYEEYLDARDAHNRMQWQAERHQAEEAGRTRHAIGQAAQTFKERMDTAARSDPAILERTAEFAASIRPSFTRAEGERLTGAHVVADEIIRSENAPLLLAHLADNPEEFQRIATLRTPTAIQLAMAKLEGRLERSDAATAGTSSEPEVSRAKPPARPVAGAPHIVSGDSGELDDNAPLSAYVLRFGQREIASRR